MLIKPVILISIINYRTYTERHAWYQRYVYVGYMLVYYTYVYVVLTKCTLEWFSTAAATVRDVTRQITGADRISQRFNMH